jgi:uncharacterized protein (TIGR02145 family)
VFGNYPVRRYIQSSGCFFPATGYRNTDGTLVNVGFHGDWWSSSPYNSSIAYNMGFDTGYAGIGTSAYRTYGFPVRCVKEFILVCDQTVQKDET